LVLGVEVAWGLADLVEAVTRLPTEGPLVARTVIVPNGRVGQALRRGLLEAGDGALLVGTRFVTAATLAREAVTSAGVVCVDGEEDRRAARVLRCFRQGVGLGHFSLEALRTRPGWDVAFAEAISDLEAAGLEPAATVADGQLADLMAVWRAVDAQAGASWTTARVVREAGTLLREGRSVGVVSGAVLAITSGHATGVEAGFLAALPDVRLVLLGQRPLRRQYVERVAALFGEDARTAVLRSKAPVGGGSERDLLASYLFAKPEVLADPARPCSAGPDGTVQLEEHAGVDAELEATADWVAHEVLVHGTPLEEIAVVVPVGDPLVAMVVERLQRLPWPEGAAPILAAGGVPGVGTAVGTRMLGVLRALREGLPVEALASVLPYLRLVGDGDTHLTHGRALDLAYSMGTTGGSAAHPLGAREWVARARDRVAELEALVATALAADDIEAAGLARELDDFRNLLADIKALTPALEALVGVADAVIAGAGLAVVGGAVLDLFDAWVLQPPDGAGLGAQLRQAVEALAAGDDALEIHGADALAAVEVLLGDLRVSVGRFGEPRVYVGTVRSAVGLSFRAVRVIGLAEGSIPAAPREDAVLPDRLRPVPVVTAAERAIAGTHALDWVVRSASRRVVLSAPHALIDGALREPSSVFVEAAAAMRRPDSVSGKHEQLIPDLVALRRDCFGPARRDVQAFRTGQPLIESAWQDRVARAGQPPPAGWRGRGANDLARLRALLDPLSAPGPLDGFLDGDLPALPGLSAERPISSGRLANLVACPHKFMYESLLGWGDPPGPRAQGEIDPLSYGSLFHAVAEEFFREHGDAFGQRSGSLERYGRAALAVVERKFTEFLGQYPLVGDGVRAQQRQRLLRQFLDILDYDWGEGDKRRFFDVERAFGYAEEVALRIGKRRLFVRGFIDRIDVEGSVTLVRDLKSGKAHPRKGREEGPTPSVDLQIGLYGLVAQEMASRWKVPKRVHVAYVYADGRSGHERAFRDDDDLLEAATQEWLGVSEGLLSEGVFPRTPDPSDCGYCSFTPVCGPQAPERALRCIETTKSKAVAQFVGLKVVDE